MKRILLTLLTTMMIGILPSMALANIGTGADGVVVDGTTAETAFDITEAPVVIDTAGTYYIDGKNTFTENTITVKDVEATLILNGVNIETAKTLKETNGSDEDELWAPIEIVNGADVTMELNGINTVEASFRYAGIHIAEGATLTIQDEDNDGTLTAIGGVGNGDNVKEDSFASGAGIGGNGAYVISASEAGNSSFGTLNIEGGTINATGGDVLYGSGNLGCAAGIGAGGVVDWSEYKKTGIQYGNVNISGGEVTAVGGGETAVKCGGAGIGTGGTESYTGQNGVEIKISNGFVRAIGMKGGAGIGGGDNVSAGDIHISGGEIVAMSKVSNYTSRYGGQLHPSGAAGIGSGDAAHTCAEGLDTAIVIDGDAKVTAMATVLEDQEYTDKYINYGAGIGSGNDGDASDITIGGDTGANEATIRIQDNATAMAIGGNGDDGISGAGIGAGCSNEAYRQSGTIEIMGTPKVVAVAGANAEAIGLGSNKIAYTEDTTVGKTNIFHVGEDVYDVWMFNRNDVENVMLGQDAEGDDLLKFATEADANTYYGGYETDGAVAVWYNQQETDEIFPIAGAAYYDTDLNESGYKWANVENATIEIYNESGILLKSFDKIMYYQAGQHLKKLLKSSLNHSL